VTRAASENEAAAEQQEESPHSARIQKQDVERKAEERRERERADRERVAREAREAAERRHRLQLEARWKEEAAVVEQYVVFDHCLVTCGAGLDIQHIVTGFELCRITIKDLPKNATKQEIADIFIQQGMPDSHFCVIEVRDVGHKRDWVVLVNAEQGQAIALGLEDIEFRNEVLKFEVTDNASARSQPFLTVRWKISNGTFIATYASNQEARKYVQKLNSSKIWKGHRIEASLENNQESANSTAVRLFIDSPDLQCDADFLDFIGTSRLRTLTRKPILHDADRVHLALRQHLSQYNALMENYRVLTPDPTATKQKIKVEFRTWEDVKQAHKSVDKKKLQFGVERRKTPCLHAWHPEPPLQYSIRIPARQYEAQKKQWDALSTRRPGCGAHVHIQTTGKHGEVFIRVLGEDQKAAGILKVRVESMVAGEVLDASHWHPSFVSIARTEPLFDRIHRATKVHLRSDFKTRSLKLYGEADVIVEARRMIKAEVDRLAEMETSTTLDGDSVGFFVREGVSKLKELIGDDNVNLGLASIPCTITIKGGEEARHHLQRLIDESRSSMSAVAAIPNLAEGETCPICHDDVSNPAPLACGHTYCSGCLKHFLVSATDAKTFPLVCMGNEASCNTPIPIPLIRRFLPAQAFDHLVEVAFRRYLERHSQELKYCTTADCKQIYRRQTNKVMLQCPSCFSEICPACDEEVHEGMSCQERRQYQVTEEQERLFNELAASGCMKNCPQCNVWIERIEGCNRMECSRCHTHFCWKCVGVFSSSREEVYQHLDSVHGGPYDAVPPGINFGRVPYNIHMAQHMEALVVAERARMVREAAEEWEAMVLAEREGARRMLLQRRVEDEERDARMRALLQQRVEEEERSRRVREAEEREALVVAERERARRVLQKRAEEDKARSMREAEEREARMRATFFFFFLIFFVFWWSVCITRGQPTPSP